MARSPGAVLALALVVAAGAFAVWGGAQRTRQMTDALRVAEATHAVQFERVLGRYPGTTEAGETLYYLAFPAGTPPTAWSGLFQGQRDINPWNHRVRLLALEGQLYDAETGNPAALAAGPLDLGFVLIVLLPLVVILLTYDVRSGEEEMGTWSLVLAQAHSAREALAAKAGARALLIGLATGLLLLLGMTVAGAPPDRSAVSVIVVVALYVTVWFVGSLSVALRFRSSTTNAMILAGAWTVAVAAGPAVLNLVSAVRHPMPEALELTVLQREGYHASWDRPVGETMEQFYVDYPHLSEYDVPAEGFSWAWYYAMNHRGDQLARESANLYAERLRARESWARRWSVLLPSVATQLALDRVAGTDVSGHLRHVQAVRDYHERLKAHFHPLVFTNTTIEDTDWTEVPRFQPKTGVATSLLALGFPLVTLLGWLLLATGSLWLAIGSARPAHDVRDRRTEPPSRPVRHRARRGEWPWTP
ncbi:MAG: DUF3526 domain-containing protein [Gemmatimonadetes bacterium]|nr:DUF3526 domain-containing protein [Gemmatimonadota bacterium]